MSAGKRGHVEHHPHCTVPLNEHNGDEGCLIWVEDKEPTPPPVARYTQGPQGNQIADYRADFLATYGATTKKGTLGHKDITDRRDNRDPHEVGIATLVERHPHTHTVTAHSNGFKP